MFACTTGQKISLVLSVVAFFAVGWGSATADDLVYAFKGVLPSGASSHTSVSDGETFTAIFTIDPSVADTNPDPTVGAYVNCVVSGALVFSGGYVSPLSFSDYEVFVFDRTVGDTVDGVQITDGSNFFQASTRDLETLSTDALPPGGVEFASGPDPDTVPFIQFTYSDTGGSISYNALSAHNVQFASKRAIAWINVAGGPTSPFYDTSSNWLSGLDTGPPISADTALFSLARTYNVWWDGITGDRTAEDLCVTNGSVTIDNRDGGMYTLTVADDVEIDGPGDLNLGDGTDTVNLDIGSFLVVDGSLNVLTGTTVSAAFAADIGRDDFGRITIDGPDTLLETGPSAMYIGSTDLGDLFISNGAVATDEGTPRLGGGPGGNGLVDVSGAGSQWNVMGDIDIGNFTDTIGFLTVSDNATATAGGNIEAGFNGDNNFNSITVDNATLTAGGDILIGGSGGATLNVDAAGTVDATDQIIIAPTGTVLATGTGGVPDFFATTIINEGQMLLDGDIGSDINPNVFNTGTIHSLNTSLNIFVLSVIHDGLEIRTDADAETRIIGTASGSGDYTGTGTVNFFGNVEPGVGNGNGTTAGISFDGDVALNSSSSLNIDIGPTGFDHLDIAGDLSIVAGASLSVDAIGGFVPCDGDQFVIVEVDGSRSGTFSGLTEGALVGTYGGTDLSISYVGGDGNDIVLNASGGVFLLGDVNLDCVVSLLDVPPFVDLIVSGGFQAEADINGDGFVNLLDVGPFVDLLTGG